MKSIDGTRELIGRAGKEEGEKPPKKLVSCLEFTRGKKNKKNNASTASSVEGMHRTKPEKRKKAISKKLIVPGRGNGAA